MANNRTTMRMQGFHILSSDDEIDLIKSLLFKNRIIIFLKRLLVITALCIIIYVMQYTARISLPHMFKSTDTLEKLHYKVSIIFWGLNILSYFQLTIRDWFAFERDRTEISIVRVCKKLKKEHLILYGTMNVRYFLCVEAPEIGVDESGFTIDLTKKKESTVFIDDEIIVDGIFNFAQVKEGQYVFIKRKYYDGYYKYRYLV